MKLERYLIKTQSDHNSNFNVWDTKRPFYFGYPLRWVIEKHTEGFRLREVPSKTKEISKCFIKDISEIQNKSLVKVELPDDLNSVEIIPVNEFSPVFTGIRNEAIDSRGTQKYMVVRTVDSWIEETVFFDRNFLGISKNEKLFQIDFIGDQVKIIWFKNGLTLETPKNISKLSRRGEVFEMPKEEFLGSKVSLPEIQWYFGVCRSEHLPTVMPKRNYFTELNDRVLFFALFLTLFIITSTSFYFHKNYSIDPYIQKKVEKEVSELDFSLKTPPSMILLKTRQALEKLEAEKEKELLALREKEKIVEVTEAAPSSSKDSPKTVQKTNIANNIIRNEVVVEKKQKSEFDQLLTSLQNTHITKDIVQVQKNEVKTNAQFVAPVTSVQTSDKLDSQSKNVKAQGFLTGELSHNSKTDLITNNRISQQLDNPSGVTYENAVSVDRLKVNNQGNAFVELAPKNAITTQGLTKDEVDSVIQKDRQTLFNCYQSSLLAGLNQEGMMLISFSVSGIGKVSNAQITKSDIQNEQLQQCVISRVKSWVFPQPVGGVTVQVKYPVQFSKIGSGL